MPSKTKFRCHIRNFDPSGVRRKGFLVEGLGTRVLYDRYFTVSDPFRRVTSDFRDSSGLPLPHVVDRPKGERDV